MLLLEKDASTTTTSITRVLITELNGKTAEWAMLVVIDKLELNLMIVIAVKRETNKEKLINRTQVNLVLLKRSRVLKDIKIETELKAKFS